MPTPLPIYRIEVTSKLAVRARSVLAQLPVIGLTKKPTLQIVDIYFLEGALSPDDLQKIIPVLSDPVTDHVQWKSKATGSFLLTPTSPPSPLSPSGEGELPSPTGRGAGGEGVIEVAYRPGVTDNVANELLHAAHRIGISTLQSTATGIRYEFSGDLTETDLHTIARSLLVNDTIQRYTLGEIAPEFIHSSADIHPPAQIDLTARDDASLIALSAERRLALDLNEMRAVQAYFAAQNRPATDAELETIAQTWSEHCVHKTFKARIQISRFTHHEAHEDVTSETLDSLIKTYLQSATNQINAPWVRSAFVDNAGVIEFDEDFDLSFKVETHNHPSAIEPFGGANTGVGGVVRDVLGVSHRPIAVTDVLCFGPADLARDALPEGVLHPARIRAGVVAGVEDYGNKLGLPTVNGAVLYHPGYTANPLVFCGCVGLGPRDRRPTTPQAGDRIIVIGGRTGRDGLRGATFSSLTMDAQTGQVAGASVQIGDPITEKGTIEVVERARDAGLYHAITDCGAGGLSSAVGEMGEHLGAFVDLAKVPLKYAGLEPWEIWLSEAQERMVLAVAPEHAPALKAICETYWVELSDIGEFGVEGGKLKVVHGEMPVVDLDMGFLHACPRLELRAEIPQSQISNQKSAISNGQWSMSNDQLLIALLSHPNIASKENIIRLYDHEVRGMSVVKPLAGVCADAPSDAAVMKPLETQGWKGFVLANGVNPLIGEVNSYAMAISVVDEAIRNAVAVGADPDRIAILDNFCWGSPRRPETLGSLVEAARGCHDAALHYGTPFISGKDSLNNEYLGSDGQRHAIPGTLLISSIGIHPDVRHAVTMDLKAAGNAVYLVGDFQPFWEGSHAGLVGGVGNQELGIRNQLPEWAPKVYRALHKAIHSGLVRAAHDLSEGGLAVAAAEMCIGGRLGLSLDISTFNLSPEMVLFGETNGCLLVEVAPEKVKDFETQFDGLPVVALGQVTETPSVAFQENGNSLLSVPLAEVVSAFHSGK
ncbi:MAG: phosphoribosylformylglycinamidine synthase subunit PurL [Anaerolineales bacterium]|nr:phosphoribosylformylglycinamidine synthase subunit PurL [Anaerolineales bacterium]